MPRHSEKHLLKFNPEKGTSVNDHIRNFYLSLQMMKVHYDDVACHLFSHTLENKVATWYRLLPITSIRTWDEFMKTFLDKFSEDKTPSMLLTELSTLKCHKKEKAKDFNKCFTIILNNFPMDVALVDSITIDYYTKALPRDISMFVKHEAMLILVENCATTLEVEKDLLSIGALEHESREDAKPSKKKNHAY